MVEGYSYARMGMVWLRGVYGWCVCIVDAIGIDRLVGGFGREVRYNWLVGKLIIPPCVCRKSIPNTTGKRIFLVTASCTWNALSSIAMDSEAIPSPMRGLSSAPETENCLGCSCGTKDNEQYSCSSNRLIEELVSIKIVIGLWSKVPYTRHWRFSRAWFWILLL